MYICKKKIKKKLTFKKKKIMKEIIERLKSDYAKLKSLTIKEGDGYFAFRCSLQRL